MFQTPRLIACCVLLAVLSMGEASNAPERQLLSMRKRGRRLADQMQSGFLTCTKYKWQATVNKHLPADGGNGWPSPTYRHTKKNKEDKRGRNYMVECKNDCVTLGASCRAVVRVYDKTAKDMNDGDNYCNLMGSLDYFKGTAGDECASRVSGNGLVCDSVSSGNYDYTIKNCDECDSNPCNHEGTCEYGEYFNSYKCNCPTGAEGPNCENCVAGFTSNGGRCDANACHPTEIPHSKNKAVNDSVTGVTGEEVDIVCDDGFTSSITPASKIQCQSNGEFTSMSCDPDPCDSNFNTAHIAPTGGSGQGTVSGATHAFNCAPGYTASGAATCSKGAWLNDATCVNVDECATSAGNNCAANAQCTDTDGSFTCACNAGYQGNGVQCSALSCASTNVANSDKSVADSISGSTGDTVPVVCDGGYGGSGNATCQTDQTFSSIVCAAGGCKPTSVPNSNKATEDSISGVTGNVVDVVCDNGFTSSIGASSVECQSNGDFTSMSCDPNPCASNFVTAHIAPTGGSGQGTVSGATVAFNCASGFTASGEATCTKGAWDSPTCDPNPCAANFVTAHIDPAGGSGKDTLSGHTHAFDCAGGFTASGVATCTEGDWDSPTCDPNPCAANFVTAHIAPAEGSGKDTVSGATVAFGCASGFTASGVATCTEGDWDSPTCDPNPCASNFVTAHIAPAGGSGQGTVSGGTHAFSCKNGYQESGVATCTEGDWNSPTCENVDECATSAGNNCAANAQCTDTDGSFTCACNAGYQGNGVTCDKIVSTSPSPSEESGAEVGDRCAVNHCENANDCPKCLQGLTCEGASDVCSGTCYGVCKAPSATPSPSGESGAEVGDRCAVNHCENANDCPKCLQGLTCEGSSDVCSGTCFGVCKAPSATPSPRESGMTPESNAAPSPMATPQSSNTSDVTPEAPAPTNVQAPSAFPDDTNNDVGVTSDAQTKGVGYGPVLAALSFMWLSVIAHL